ncbi:MAG: MFS transporter [Gammaproteobacteria bacterium]|nr:MFS transporter [Gammaproteobacteria bacterium]
MLRIIILIALAALGALASAAIDPVLPQIRDYFHQQGDPAAIERLAKMLMGLPSLVCAFSAPFVGWLGDRFGRVRLLMGGLFIYGITGTVGLYAESIYWILGARALMGVGVAASMTLPIALIGDYYAGDQRRRVIALLAGMGTLAGFVVAMSAGGLGQYFGWRAVFALYTLPLILLVFVWRLFPEVEKLQMTQQQSQLTFKQAIQGIWYLYPILLVTVTFFFALIVHMPFYLNDHLHVMDPTKIAAVFALSTLTGGLSALSYSWLLKRLNQQQVFAVIFMFSALGFGLCALWPQYTVIIVGAALAGIGMGLVTPHINTLILMSVDPAWRGRLIAGVTSTIFLSQFLSVALTQPLTEILGYPATFGLIAMCFAALSIVAWLPRQLWWPTAKSSASL